MLPQDWIYLEQLFGERGACGGCWCMEWRREGTARAVRQCRGKPNRTAMRALVQGGSAHGALAFSESGEPIGWCSVDVHTAFPALARKRSLKTERDAATWSITCFFIRRDHRGRGVATALAREAVRLARASGATRLEGYPAKVSAGRSLPGAFAWTGTEALFRAAGFTPDVENPRVFVVRFNPERGRATADSRTRGGRRS
jgi:GNAT superfamily N-acetyltransferase